ncbi:hypothetical protein H5410_058733, partial [Solanum commersonii]
RIVVKRNPLPPLRRTRKSKMTQTGSRVSESGASNESIPNTSSPNEVEVVVDTSKKRKAMEPRANCWKHFDKFTDESGASKAKCKYCAKP